MNKDKTLLISFKEFPEAIVRFSFHVHHVLERTNILPHFQLTGQIFQNFVPQKSQSKIKKGENIF
jgi:hypothetical protein